MRSREMCYRVSLPSSLDQASISTGPSYTKAYLSELKASTPSTPAVRAPIPQTESDTSFDVSFDIDGAVVEGNINAFIGQYTLSDLLT